MDRPPITGAAGADVEVRIYENEVPEFVERHLELLYQSLFSTVARIDICASLKDASTYVVRKGGQVVTVFLFRRERHRVRVYNEQLAIDGSEVHRFASYIFSQYKTVSLISFYAVDADTRGLAYPVQKEDCLEDIVMALPPDGDAYLEQLGKNTRASIKRYQKRVSRDFPSFHVEFKTNKTVSESQIRSIVEFSQARMARKNQRGRHTEATTRQLIQLVRKYGTVLIATIDSRICAGVINHRVGDHYFLHVIAHDPHYDDYRLGKICLYLSIRQAIADGAKEYHFGWGRLDYKFKMGGEQRELYRLEIYRSRLMLAAHLRHFLQTRVDAKVRQFKLWVERQDQAKARGEEPAHPGVMRAFDAARKLKRTIRGQRQRSHS